MLLIPQWLCHDLFSVPVLKIYSRLTAGSYIQEAVLNQIAHKTSYKIFGWLGILKSTIIGHDRS